MSPETGLLPGHLTQQHVAVGNRRVPDALYCCALRLSFSIQFAALRVSITEKYIEIFLFDTCHEIGDSWYRD
jgi:hypothetical protein